MMYYHQGVILLHVINLNGKNSNIKPIHMCMAQFQHFFSYNPTKNKKQTNQSVPGKMYLVATSVNCVKVRLIGQSKNTVWTK